MTGAECLADMLKGYGVTHVFHVPAVLRKTMAVMESRTDIKRLHVHGEKAAAFSPCTCSRLMSVRLSITAMVLRSTAGTWKTWVTP